MNILIIFTGVTVVLLSLTVTTLIITIKNLIKTKQEIKLMKQNENAYQHYSKQEIIIDERLNADKNEIATGNINDLFHSILLFLYYQSRRETQPSNIFIQYSSLLPPRQHGQVQGEYLNIRSFRPQPS